MQIKYSRVYHPEMLEPTHCLSGCQFDCVSPIRVIGREVVEMKSGELEFLSDCELLPQSRK